MCNSIGARRSALGKSEIGRRISMLSIEVRGCAEVYVQFGIRPPVVLEAEEVELEETETD